MAPRGRPKKRGHTRMDAALDAMCPYGFPAKLVRRTVHELLNIYGGNDGWVFIEDAAYTLLIETILEKQNISSQALDGSIQDSASNDDLIEALPAGSSIAVLVPCSNTETLEAASRTNEAVYPASTTKESGNQLPIRVLDCQLEGNIASSENHGTTLTNSPAQSKSPQPGENLCHRRRRPCHGWISSDEEEDLIELPPSSLPKELAMLIDRIN